MSKETFIQVFSLLPTDFFLFLFLFSSFHQIETKIGKGETLPIMAASHCGESWAE
jgi:hypothetical protein